MMTETSVLSSRLKVEVQRNCLSSVGSLFYARGAATEKAVTNPIRVVRGTTRSPLTLIPISLLPRHLFVSVPFCCRLRSADMIVPRTRTARYGPRSFRVAAPQIWNMLPPHLKNINVSRGQFKSGLKTWLFVQV